MKNWIKWGAVALLWSSPAFTQEEASNQEPPSAEGEETAADSETGEAAETEQKEASEVDGKATGDKNVSETPPPETADEDKNSPIEKPGQTYYFAGLRYRGIIIPKFMMNLFGDGGDTVWVHSFGPEFTIRKDHFEYVLSIWYAAYSMDPTPFKASSDGELAWEIVESKLKALYLTSDFLWSSELSPAFSINYGFGAGLGIVFGDLLRSQSYPESGVAGDPYDYKACVAPGNPNAQYCDDGDDHYPGYEEPSWANGGSKPILFPWFVLQTGFRVKPHRNFAARFDLGFGTSGFFLGLAGNYGI